MPRKEIGADFNEQSHKGGHMYWLIGILSCVAFLVGFWVAALAADSKNRQRCYECSRLSRLNDPQSIKT